MPIIENRRLYEKAMSIIHRMYGPGALFRDGQYEAIEAVMSRRRTLVVQRTGWGKSLVYFVCTKLMREQNRGVTMVVSPLLVLMQNQVEAAERLGLCCDVLNSRTKERWNSILPDMENDELDLVLVTPETLFNADVQKHLRNIRIGLFVIDEAHCISDWGHDFRLEYSRLNQVIRSLPPSVPILATNKGGTWSGATENLKNGWCPEFCWDQERYPGNRALIQKGAHPIDEKWDGDVIPERDPQRELKSVQMSIFDL